MNFGSIPLSYIPRMGEKSVELLKKELGLETFSDLLFYYPFRYIDRRKVYQIRELHRQMEEVQVIAVLQGVYQEGKGRNSRLKAVCSDGTGTLSLVWFRGINYIANSLEVGKAYLFFGKPTLYGRQFSMSHPEVAPPDRAAFWSQGLQAVYSSTERLKRSRIHSERIAECVRFVLNHSAYHVPERIDNQLKETLRLLPIEEALKEIHHPSNEQQLEAAKRRLKFDELLFLQLYLRRSAALRQVQYKGYRFDTVGDHFMALFRSLPFSLTDAQKRVIKEMRQDTLTGRQMNRLLQGDVGSGKTLVALMMMLLAIDNGKQTCMMAPTEILAQQHYETILEFLQGIPVRVALLTGSTSQAARREILSQLSMGEIDILIGTHALIEPGVIFASLGLAVIDEQHRFGVVQRAKLWNKNIATLPHILIMSATPIPRTLAMTVYGDLDVSIIDQLPPGRKPIVTKHFYHSQQEQVLQAIRNTILQKQQVYVVFPMIEGTEDSDYKNVAAGYELFVHTFGEKQVTYVHGKLSPSDKQKQMDLFASGAVPILLSTTVIEVGVNVPNATLMVIFDAQRFGLAQLHQLRGRVGRGAKQSFCFLVTKPFSNPQTQRRIEVMVQTQDGFVIAEEDLRLRGFGDLEGTQQSGDLPGLVLANPIKDVLLVQQAHEAAKAIIEKDPLLTLPQHQCYADGINQLKGNDLDLGKIS